MYLLDTNAVSTLLRGDDMRVRQRFLQAGADACRVSVITEAELLYGLARKNWPRRLHDLVASFLASIPILPWGSGNARCYAEMRASLARSGRALSDFDALIAAHAASEALVLVSADKAFRHVPDLTVEDWTQP